MSSALGRPPEVRGQLAVCGLFWSGKLNPLSKALCGLFTYSIDEDHN